MMQSVSSSSIPIPGRNVVRGNFGDHPSTTQNVAPGSGSSGSSETITSPITSPSSNPNAHILIGSGRQRRPRSRRDKEKRFVCDHPGCDKTYTRAEHLTRHQLNRESPFPRGYFALKVKQSADDLCRHRSIQIRLPSRSALREKICSCRFTQPP